MPSSVWQLPGSTQDTEGRRFSWDRLRTWAPALQEFPWQPLTPHCHLKPVLCSTCCVILTTEGLPSRRRCPLDRKMQIQCFQVDFPPPVSRGPSAVSKWQAQTLLLDEWSLPHAPASETSFACWVFLTAKFACKSELKNSPEVSSSNIKWIPRAVKRKHSEESPGTALRHPEMHSGHCLISKCRG